MTPREMLSEGLRYTVRVENEGPTFCDSWRASDEGNRGVRLH